MRWSIHATVVAVVVTALLGAGAILRASQFREPGTLAALGLVALFVAIPVIAGLARRTATPYW